MSDDIKNFIPPCYDGGDDDDDLDEEISRTDIEGDEDESRVESFVKEQNSLNDKALHSSPFGSEEKSTISFDPTAQGQTQSAWGQQSPQQPAQSTPGWGSWGNSGGTGWGTSSVGSSWGTSSSFSSPTPWGSATSQWGQSQPQQANPQTDNKNFQINRSKKIVICDLLDCIVETFSSKGVPGLIPRDIYDMTPRFDVWEKLKAINPDFVCVLALRNTMRLTNGADEDGWRCALEFLSYCVSAFLRKPYKSCKIILQNNLGQPKSEVIKYILEELRCGDGNYTVDKKDVVYIGVYSGQQGFSNDDLMSATENGIDYIDLKTLLTRMY